MSKDLVGRIEFSPTKPHKIQNKTKISKENSTVPKSVKCLVTSCPLNLNGICSKITVVIDEAGVCKTYTELTRHGS